MSGIVSVQGLDQAHRLALQAGSSACPGMGAECNTSPRTPTLGPHYIWCLFQTGLLHAGFNACPITAGVHLVHHCASAID